MRRRLVALALWSAVGGAAGADEVRNWFGDPYFQVRAAVPGCPVPRGPLMTEDEMRRSAHARAERGTRCWQEGACAKPNAYMYDAALAEAVKQRFAASPEPKAASLWVTVQRRFVYVEGCAERGDAAKRIEGLLRGVPDVERVVLNIGRRPFDRVPYATLEYR